MMEKHIWGRWFKKSEWKKWTSETAMLKNKSKMLGPPTLCLWYTVLTEGVFLRAVGLLNLHSRFPWWLSGKESGFSAGDTGDLDLIPGIGKMPWRSAWQPTLVFLPGKSHEQRSLVGYSPWGPKKYNSFDFPQKVWCYCWSSGQTTPKYLTMAYVTLLSPSPWKQEINLSWERCIPCIWRYCQRWGIWAEKFV